MRISVTDVDRLCYIYGHDWTNPTVAELLADLKGGRETEAMRRGSAFHEILETCDLEDLDVVDHGDFRFEFTLEEELALPEIRELKGECYLDIGGIPVTLSGKVDAIDGKTVFDHKLTSKFDHETYEASVQWRAYLMMFQADTFQYNVFEQKSKDGVVKVRKLHQLRMHRYPGMEDCVLCAVREFVGFCKKYWPERVEDDSFDVKQPF